MDGEACLPPLARPLPQGTDVATLEVRSEWSRAVLEVAAHDTVSGSIPTCFLQVELRRAQSAAAAAQDAAAAAQNAATVAQKRRY